MMNVPFLLLMRKCASVADRSKQDRDTVWTLTVFGRPSLAGYHNIWTPCCSCADFERTEPSTLSATLAVAAWRCRCHFHGDRVWTRMLPCSILALGLVAMNFQAQETKKDGKKLEKKPPMPSIPPTHGNVSYGKHERNVLDFWQAKSDK